MLELLSILCLLVVGPLAVHQYYVNSQLTSRNNEQASINAVLTGKLGSLETEVAALKSKSSEDRLNTIERKLASLQLSR